ncbi:MAG: Unknown protein [uncultured Sulfurovum sp.]|uniref:Prepilin-type N-terminal cleavage/methylation domain-containing protein n=1 Tax=uncultured Sulfurovum sp. TaxID=269237 RepID=A0A6S6TZD6_9BACT|nr:MAG: Unknown protein [uncultured Sulfurovum sp.]
MKKNRLGFTLVELLVTIVLFSLLLATALYSFRFISINMRNINNTNPQDAMNFNLLKDVFSSTFYYIDTDNKKLEGRERYFYYFNGTKDSCRFVSNSSLFFDELVVVQLSLKDAKLIYEEGRIFQKNINYQDLENIQLTERITILKNLEMLNFKYKTHKGIKSEIFKEIPRGVEINFKGKVKEYNYIFSVKSRNITQLESLIRDYDLSRSSLGGQ